MFRSELCLAICYVLVILPACKVRQESRTLSTANEDMAELDQLIDNAGLKTQRYDLFSTIREKSEQLEIFEVDANDLIQKADPSLLGNFSLMTSVSSPERKHTKNYYIRSKDRSHPAVIRVNSSFRSKSAVYIARVYSIRKPPFHLEGVRASTINSGSFLGESLSIDFLEGDPKKIQQDFTAQARAMKSFLSQAMAPPNPSKTRDLPQSVASIIAGVAAGIAVLIIAAILNSTWIDVRWGKKLSPTAFRFYSEFAKGIGTTIQRVNAKGGRIILIIFGIAVVIAIFAFIAKQLLNRKPNIRKSPMNVYFGNMFAH